MSIGTLAGPAPSVNGSGTRPFLDVRDLRVHFPTDDGVVKSVDGMSFTLERGKTLGIVGESGSGKSVTSLSIMGLHKRGAAKVSGEVLLDGEDIVQASPGIPTRRLMAVCFLAFAALAVVVAGLGIFGVVTHDFARRRFEFALRLALGANPAKLHGSILGRTAAIVAAVASADSFRSSATMRAPWRANRAAIAAPMLDPAPVTTATFWLRSNKSAKHHGRVYRFA